MKTHLFGFLMSLALTFLAIGAKFYTDLSNSVVFTIILLLAFVQATLQLFMFMHITEQNKFIQVGTMIYSVFISVCIIAGSIWVMAF